MFELNPYLKDFWLAKNDPDGNPVWARVLYGGRASSKSHDTAGMAIARANYGTQRVLCLRMYQNRIQDSVYSLLKDKIHEGGFIKNFRIYKDAIEHKTNGSIFKFYGCARNIDEIKSFEKASICWVEEAQNFTKEMFDIIKPTIIRNAGAEMWFTFNPQLYSDFIYQRLVVAPPKGCISRLVNYINNPFLVEGAIREIQNEKDEDIERYNHIYLGVPLLDDDMAIIKRTWVEAAVDAHKVLGMDFTGLQTVGYDVADSGIDRNCAVCFDGSIATHLDAWKAGEDELTESLMRAYGHMVDGGRFVYDAIGVGAHCGSTLNAKGIEYNHYKFNAGDAVKDPDNEYSHNITNKQKFENRKAQAWQCMSDRFRNTYNAVKKGKVYEAHELISISSDLPLIEELKNELCIPHRAYSKRGMDMVESKKDIKKRLNTDKSPDLADAFVMGACTQFADIESLSYFDLEW